MAKKNILYIISIMLDILYQCGRQFDNLVYIDIGILTATTAVLPSEAIYTSTISVSW